MRGTPAGLGYRAAGSRKASYPKLSAQAVPPWNDCLPAFWRLAAHGTLREDWLAHPAQAPLMQYVFLAVVLAGVAVSFGQVWLRRRREAPLRREIRSQGVTFWVRLPQVKVSEDCGWPRWLSLNSSMALYVRRDSFDVSSVIPPIRLVMGRRSSITGHTGRGSRMIECPEF